MEKSYNNKILWIGPPRGGNSEVFYVESEVFKIQSRTLTGTEFSKKFSNLIRFIIEMYFLSLVM